MLAGGPGRLHWRLDAVESWMSQRGVETELLVVSELPVLSPLPNVRWVHADPGMDIGSKRNRAAAAAFGTLIAHWDDDDWSASGRLAQQAAAFQNSRIQVCGYRSALFLDVPRLEVWRYTGDAQYVIGSSLMYRREWIMRHPFPRRQTGEDNAVVTAARREGVLAVLDNPGLLVCRTHPECVTRRDHRRLMAGPQWQQTTTAELPADFPVR
jgi:hypothetical protein